MLHGQLDEAEAVTADIEKHVAAVPPARAGGAHPPGGVVAQFDGRGGAGGGPAIPAAGGARPRADGHAGVFLQRDLLFLRAGADPVLQCAVVGAIPAGTFCPSRSAISAQGPCCCRAALRHHGPQADDRTSLSAISGILLAIVGSGYLTRLRMCSAPRRWPRAGPASSSSPRRRRAPPALTSRQELPAAGHALAIAFLLRDRHREQRRGRAYPVRGADQRAGDAGRGLSRLSVRRRPDDRRRHRRAADRRQRRTPALGERRPAHLIGVSSPFSTPPRRRPDPFFSSSDG